MKYAEIRPAIKTGDLIAFSHQGSWLSRHGVETHITRLATESQWTHVGLAWVEHDRVWVMDLTTRGCAPRLLSSDLPFYWMASPWELSEKALQHAFSRFGEMQYSRWQAVLGFLKRLTIGADNFGECAEYVIEILRTDNMHPTLIATPSALVDAAMEVWGCELVKVTA